MSLRVLGKKSGVSANALSLIERSKTSPTVSTLMAIARGFGVRITEFFSGEGNDKGDFVVFRGSGGTQDSAIEAMATNLKSQNLNPLLLRLASNQKFRKNLCFHPGDEFVYCLSGQIECQVGAEKIVLAQGDAVTYKGEIPHRIRNLAPAGSNALVVFEVGRL